jgi:hypothetical protein
MTVAGIATENGCLAGAVVVPASTFGILEGRAFRIASKSKTANYGKYRLRWLASRAESNADFRA